VAVDVAKLKEAWTGFAFDEVEFDVTSEELVEYARAVGETQGRFVDPSHPEFRAVPNFTTKYHGRRMFPENFPTLSKRHFGFDAGKCVEVHGPIHPGDRLIARSRIHDVYEKTGRSGAMVFIVHRMEFSNQRSDLVAIVDWRFVQRPDPE